MTIVFSNYSPKIHKLGIFVPKFKDFFLYQTTKLNKFEGKISRDLISNMTMAFLNFSPKICK